MVKVIDENLRLKIYDLLITAKELINNKKHTEAESLCDQAWALMPEPKAGWDSSYVILRGVVMRLRDIGNNKKAILRINEFLKDDSIFTGQAEPLFLLGAAYYDNNQYDEALDYLVQANHISKGRCFVEEPSRYKDFLKSKKK